MTSCSLVAPGLVPQVSGQTPTFSYRPTGHNGDYFGVQMTYMNGASTCYSGQPRFTPVIQNPAQGYSVDCQFIISEAYSGIFCPNAPVTRIPNGVMTVSYKNGVSTQPTPIPFLATFGTSPVPRTVTATSSAVFAFTATRTSTASPNYASTAIVYAAGATQTYTNTVIVTRTQTTTNTNYISSCAIPPAASSSIRSSSSLSPSFSPGPSPSASGISEAFPIPRGYFNSCPLDMGKYVRTPAGIFQITCNFDRDGATTGLFRPGNGLLGCIDLCSDTDGCVWSSYYHDRDACYLKFGEGSLDFNMAVWGARMVAAFSPAVSPSIADGVSSRTSLPTSTLSLRPLSSSTVTPSLPPSSGLRCPEADDQTFTTGGKVFQIACGYDRQSVTTGLFQPGNGLPGCVNLCANTRDCVWSTYFAVLDHCYLKFGEGIVNYNMLASGAKLLNAPSSGSVVSPPTASSTRALSAVASSSSAASSSSSHTASPALSSVSQPALSSPETRSSSSTTTSRSPTLAQNPSSGSTTLSTPAASPSGPIASLPSSAAAPTSSSPAVSRSSRSDQRSSSSPFPSGPGASSSLVTPSSPATTPSSSSVVPAPISSSPAVSTSSNSVDRPSSSNAASSSPAVSLGRDASSTAATSSNADPSSSAVQSLSPSATTSSGSAVSPTSSAVASSLGSEGRTSSNTPISDVSSAASPIATSTSISCPADDGKTLTTPSGAFVIECYVDRSGGDLSTQYPDGGFNGCVQLCANTPTCIDVSYVPNGVCYLKSAIGTSQTNSGIWGARSAAGAVSPTASTSSATIPSVASSTSAASPSSTGTADANVACPADDGKTFTTSAGVFTIECYTDRRGNDIGAASSSSSSYTGCINACATTSGCQAVSYVPNGTCYLKNGIGAASTNNGIWGARISAPTGFSTPVAASSSSSPSSGPTVTSSSSTDASTSTTSTASAATSAVVCPTSDGDTINTSAGSFLVECGIDRSGNDMANSPVYPGSYEACIATCAKRASCMTVSFIPNGPCYLKSSAGSAGSNANIIGGRLLGGSSISDAVSSSSLSPAATSAVGIPVQTMTVTTTIGGTGYQCACTPTNRLGSGPAPSAAATPGAALACPSSDGSTFTSDCGATYAIECYSDRYGDDIAGGTSYTNTLNDCIADCDKTTGCINVSYASGSPGACYKKSKIAAIQRNNNIFGARQLTQCTASGNIKLHRKRVLRTSPELEKKVQKRGVYGPDFTHTQEFTTTTQTTTSTYTYITTVTATPANVGTTTRTVYTTAATTATVTRDATVTETRQTVVTTCPAVTRRSIL